jgi:hypothetical protein
VEVCLKNEYKIFGDYAVVYAKRWDSSIHEIKVDLDDLERLINFKYSWHVWWNKKTQSFYAMCTVYTGMVNGSPTNQIIYLHRYIMNASDNDYVDHRNFDTLDNTKNNLRVTTNAKNSQHKNGKNKNNTSGHRNVSWNKTRQKWAVQLQVNGKNKVLGWFKYEELENAAEFAEEMRQLYYGEFAGKK